MHRSFFAVVTAAALVGQPPSHARRAGNEVSFTLVRLELDVAPNYEDGTLAGSATLVLRNNATAPADRVPLLLNRLMTVSEVTTPAGRPISFSQEIKRFADDDRLQVNAIEIRPRRLVAPGDSITLVVHYGGVLVGYTETGSLYIRDHVAWNFTILRADAFAFPILGVPSWKTNRAMPEAPFTFSARVTVPQGLTVAMGGVEGARTSRDSLVTWTWHSDAPVPFLNITIAPYRLLEQGAARIFYFPEDSIGAAQLSGAIANAMDRYTRWFGPLRSSARLTVMEIPEGWGSQGSLSAGIIQTADAFRDRSQLPQLYHELSHLWNPVDRERPSPRWNEGLAGFLQWRMAAELDSWNQWPARVERALANARRNCAPASPCDAVAFVDYGKARLTDRSYSVGFLMFYSLYRVMGPDKFDQAYGRFFQEHQGTDASTGDLVSAFEAVDPRAGRVFEDWLMTTRWSSRLAAGESVDQVIADYR